MRVPRATYRLRLGPGLTFDAAAALVDYLDALGVSDAYTSPFFGALNSLAQTLIKITAPGVPDFYQGTELWDLSLVDPDNRRPVDWALRRRLLGELERALASTSDRAGFAFGLFKEKEDGRVKLYIIREALALRRARPTLIAAGDYRALEARGALAEHLCAFARVGADGAALTVVPRLLARRGFEAPPLGREYWEDTTLVVPVDLGVRFVDARRATTPCRSATCLPTSRLLCSARTLDDPHHGPAHRLHRLRAAAPGARPSRHRRARAVRAAGGGARRLRLLSHARLLPAPSPDHHRLRQRLRVVDRKSTR